MFLQFLAGLACLIAAVLQFAVFRDPSIIDRKMRRNARRIVTAALTIGALFSFNACANETTPSAGYLVLILVAFSQSIFAISDLLPHLEEHPWISRLSNSP